MMGGIPLGPITMSLDEAHDLMSVPPKASWPRTIEITQHQARALQSILERDRTAWISHGGLCGLLGITDSQVLALMDVVTALRVDE